MEMSMQFSPQFLFYANGLSALFSLGLHSLTEHPLIQKINKNVIHCCSLLHRQAIQVLHHHSNHFQWWVNGFYFKALPFRNEGRAKFHAVKTIVNVPSLLPVGLLSGHTCLSAEPSEEEIPQSQSEKSISWWTLVQGLDLCSCLHYITSRIHLLSAHTTLTVWTLQPLIQRALNSQKLLFLSSTCARGGTEQHL